MSVKKAAPRRSPAAQARAAQQSGRRQEALALLGALDCLRGVPPSELARLNDLCVFRTFQTGATVLGQQKHDRFLFLVLRGTLQLRLRDKDGREVLMGVLARGDCCGEGPLFGDFFRRMSALAQSDCQLLQVPLAELRASFGTMPMLSTALRQVYKRRMVECTLARVPLLGQLVPMERLALANLLQPAHFARNELIMRQGGSADALYLIESGQVSVEQGGQTLATLGEGDFFGEIALLTSGPHGADVRALTPTDVLALPGADFHRLIEGRPDLEAQLRSVVEKRIRNNAAMRGDDSRARELELAVSRGLLRGDHLLVRTPSLCPPGCSICEQACADRHGRSRLSLNGVALDRLDVVDTCRQCSVGAECVEACPEDAIERAETGTLVITDKCTGCGQCITACPYDAVASVPLPSPRPAGGPLFALLQAATLRIRRVPAIPLEPARPTRRADKCDLCHGFDDLACLSKCPTGSLRLIPVEEIFPL
ncbi:MAG: cyclic nucleotide-binding domain-containing protein [Chloroflexales bacterium]|nr:cyclic nucleotide-binding domain-containing protein [Chloroflexales bacterium]